MLATIVGHWVTGWRGLIQELRDPYRPELHYMRGPGPRYREKRTGRSA